MQNCFSCFCHNIKMGERRRTNKKNMEKTNVAFFLYCDTPSERGIFFIPDYKEIDGRTKNHNNGIWLIFYGKMRFWGKLVTGGENGLSSV